MYVRLMEFALVVLLISSLFDTASGDPSRSRGSLVYSRDQLFALRSSAPLPKERPDVPPELRRRKRGCRAGVERRARRRRYRPVLPSIIMGNVRSLPNKMDELAALTRHQREYRESSLLLFTETWLTALTPDTAAQLEGFTLLRADRSRESGKRKGGGPAVFVNDRWCNPGHITIREQHCCKDIELLAVSMRPHYLPREFTHALAVVVYIPPSANADAACDVLLSAVSRLQTQHPDALLLISGDFNHASPSSSLPKFTQYVTCHTRDNKTLDLFYANTKEAYHSLPLPPLGRADHNLVHLQPVYKPLVQRQPAVTRTVKKWSEEAEEALKDCFNTTLWDVFSDAHGEDIDNLTSCITDYINFCVENTVPTRTVWSFSTSKPWITPDIKALLKEKKRAFVSGDKEELKTVQRELRRKIRQEKDNYRRKMENQLQQNNICGVWKGLKTISGFKEQKSQPVGDRGLLCCYPRHCLCLQPIVPPVPLPPSLMNFSSHIPDTSHPGPCPSPPPTPPCSSLSLTPHQVRKALKKNRARKATGPDGISSRLLKSCADQLCGIFSHTFNLSLRLGRVPQLWKTSCIVPVPKTPHPKELNSYRPVALTSHLMKTLERLILDHLRPLVSSFMDPLQFAYQPSIGVDDAVIYLLHTSLTHLEKAGSTCIQHHPAQAAGGQLEVAGVDHHLTTWILDYLTQRPQFVRVKGSESDRLLCSTGVPQGTVLAPFLFTLYTADFSYSTSSCHLQKFSDDSAAVGLITDGDDTEYRELIQGFVDWSLRNNLQINAGKTKELVVDFRRRNNPPPAPVNILGTDVDVVESYKYLGVHLNNNLDWTHNTDALVKKGNSRLFLLRRLRSFGVQGPLLRTFYDSVVGSAIFYGIVCWSSSITDRDRKRMDRLVRRASSVLGCPLDSVEVVGNGRMMAKLSSMLNNTSHPLQDTLTALGSSFSERLLHPRCVKERYRRSFLPAAVRLHNKQNNR
ncbi:RNA-directed DNA polymerase from mobile element jockey [Takifugu flavidus]|uniref:RNA-directed DNA polymerase from mobile element jockey n=1 Tax=Takifugu flavidus TaxID=433684 RepID=A0A5C6MIJ9_9TELE|nr:RNA-directed DNA polymerase from mobile element jockey [Takifugu flavidus]